MRISESDRFGCDTIQHKLSKLPGVVASECSAEYDIAMEAYVIFMSVTTVSGKKWCVNVAISRRDLLLARAGSVDYRIEKAIRDLTEIVEEHIVDDPIAVEGKR